MTLNDLMKEINSKLSELETGSGNIHSRATYEKRMSVMKDMVNKIDNFLASNDFNALIDLKNRINNSIGIMETANMCGLINEP